MSNSTKNSKASVKPKSGQAKVSAKVKKTITARPSRSKSEQQAVKTVKPCSRNGADQRRLLFVEAYIANGCNATQAAIAVGFSEKSAYSQGHDLLKHPEVAEAISKRQAALAEKFRLTTNDVLNELRRMVHVDPRKFFNADGSLKRVTDLDDDCAAALASVEIDELRAEGNVLGVTQKIKFWDKNSAIEKAMKHLGLYERDNAQKTDPITEFLMQCSGKSLPIIPE